MPSGKEKRKSIRYEISEYIKEDFYKDIRMEINSKTVFKPKILDISMNGIGFMLEESQSVSLEDFDNNIDFFINIYFANKVILSEVKKIWSIKIVDKGKRLLKGGIVFSVMSPEDRLSLAEYINSLRC